MAKILFPESVLCVNMSDKERQQATQVPDAFRDYLHAKKYEAYCKLKGIDTTKPESSLLQLAATQAELKVYDELLQFIANRQPQDFDTE